MTFEAAAFRALVTYEAVAIHAGRTWLPPITRPVMALPWAGRVAVTAGMAAWLVYHFEVHRVPRLRPGLPPDEG